MKEDLHDILFTEESLRNRVAELGAHITLDYANMCADSGRAPTCPLLVGILKGSFIFLADLSRSIDLNCEIRFLSASSYGFSSVTSGRVKIGSEFDSDITGRHVILIEDILDSGVTMAALRKFISRHEPKSLKVCALLDKPARRQVQIDADYVGFVCPDEFVVGYGLDYAERYRNLPFIASLKPEIYE